MRTAFSSTVQYLWAASAALQLLVFTILVIRGLVRKLPLFTAYIVLNLCQAFLLYAVYKRFGNLSHAAYLFAWWAEATTLVARAFATVEILKLAMASYRGIWALVWRLLAACALFVLICIALASRGDASWALMEADRGYHLIFATALVACLVLIRHYFIAVEPTYKILLISFCFYSCIKVLLNTVFQGFLYPQYIHFGAAWQIVAMLSYLLVLIAWAAALARPIPLQSAPQVLPAHLYTQISPEINFQLHAMNKQLMNFWNLGEPRH